MPAPPDDRRPGLEPPRFGLGTLMWAVAVVAGFCALFGYLGSHATLLLVLLALAILAHVAGNALGTRLRQNGDTPLGETSGRPSRRALDRGDFAPVTRLHERNALGWPVLALTVSGALGAGGAAGLALWLYAPQAVPWVVGLGALAAATLGGIATFISASFLQVAGGALWQASRETKQQPERRSP